MYSFNTYFEHSLWARSSVGRGVCGGGRGQGRWGRADTVERNTAACVGFKHKSDDVTVGPQSLQWLPKALKQSKPPSTAQAHLPTLKTPLNSLSCTLHRGSGPSFKPPGFCRCCSFCLSRPPHSTHTPDLLYSYHLALLLVSPPSQS